MNERAKNNEHFLRCLCNNSYTYFIKRRYVYGINDWIDRLAARCCVFLFGLIPYISPLCKDVSKGLLVSAGIIFLIGISVCSLFKSNVNFIKHTASYLKPNSHQGSFLNTFLFH